VLKGGRRGRVRREGKGGRKKEGRREMKGEREGGKGWERGRRERGYTERETQARRKSVLTVNFLEHGCHNLEIVMIQKPN
jgi:hypothetical protein